MPGGILHLVPENRVLSSFFSPPRKKTARMALAPMRSLRSLEKISMVIGCVLLVTYACAQIHSSLMARAGLLSFRVHQLHAVQAASTQSADSSVDFSLWSAKRIQAYKDSLLMKMEPPIAVLSIPKIGIEVPVFDGTDNVTLNRGAGRIAGTADPDGTGNIGIAGHRDGFFRGLKDIRMGDQIKLSALKSTFVYAVDNVVIVAPTDISVLRPGSHPSLTLVTCYPFYFVGDAPQRYIVHASLMDNPPSSSSSLNSAVQPKKSENAP